MDHELREGPRGAGRCPILGCELSWTGHPVMLPLYATGLIFTVYWFLNYCMALIPALEVQPSLSIPVSLSLSLPLLLFLHLSCFSLSSVFNAEYYLTLYHVTS